jgi:biopolymer transport protein ExbB/TolQ/prefoldin subunit 5
VELLRILFLENSAEGILIILVLLILLGAAFRFARLHRQRYDRHENGLLDKVITASAAVSENKADGDPDHVLTQLIDCLPNDNQGRLRESIIGDRLLALRKMRASHAKVNVQALQEMSIAKEAARRGIGFPSFVVGFAMLLGLLGTIIGLTKMVQTIHLTLPTAADTLTQASWSESLNNVREVMSSMKSAFSATLVGLFCSITASLLNLRLEKAQSRFFEKLERFTIEELLPKTSPTMEDETLLQSINTQMERYFDELREVAEQNNQTIQDLSAAQKAFETTIASIEQMSRGNSPGGVQEVIGQLAGVIGELSGVNRSIVTLTGRLPETLDMARQANHTMQQRVETLLDSHKQWQARIDTSLSDVTRTLPGLLNQLERGGRNGGGVRPEAAAGPARAPVPHRHEETKVLEEPLSQRTFFIYSGAATLLLVLILLLSH